MKVSRLKSKSAPATKVGVYRKGPLYCTLWTVQLGYTQRVYEGFSLQKFIRYTTATQAVLYTVYRARLLYCILLYGYSLRFCYLRKLRNGTEKWILYNVCQAKTTSCIKFWFHFCFTTSETFVINILKSISQAAKTSPFHIFTFKLFNWRKNRGLEWPW